MRSTDIAADENARTDAAVRRGRALIPVGVEAKQAEYNLPITIPGFGDVPAGALPTFQRMVETRARSAESAASRQFTAEQNEMNRQSREKAAKSRAAGSNSANPEVRNDAQAIADGIVSGIQPPTLTGLYRNAAPVRAELARRGYDLSTATRDWAAVQRHMATLQGPQQERLRQAVVFTYDSLDIIEDLFKEWEGSGVTTQYPILNKAVLATSKQVPGKTGEIARALEAQINDLISELGTVYKGGNASTDETLRLAAENLKADWTPGQFKKQLGLIRKNLLIRKNAILSSEPVGVTPGSSYVPPSQSGAHGTMPVPGASADKDPLGIRK
jgi:hypothetical protein